MFPLENKPGHRPRLDTLEKVAYALGLSPAFLAYGLADECPPGETLRATGVGSRLKATREARHLSMRALARAAGLTGTGVRSTENGETMPNIATVEALAKVLAVSPGWLAFGIAPVVASHRAAQQTPAAE